MSTKAKARHIRISPQKVRSVANEIRGKKLSLALDILNQCQRKAAAILNKLLRSAMSNAEAKGDMDIDNLFVKELLVDAGPTLKRWMPRAKGSASPILKRTSHISVVLEEK